MARILAIGAHFDDVELGCGGSLLAHAAAGDRITLFVATHSGYRGADGLEVRSARQAREEGEEAAALLGARLVAGGFPTCALPGGDEVVLAIRRLCEEEPFDLAYVHWPGDPHPDHADLAKYSLAATRHLPSILMYRSNHYLGAQEFQGRVFRDISPFLEEKFRLLRCFASEFQRAGGRWEAYWRAEHARDGMLVGVEAAEAFQPVKLLF